MRLTDIRYNPALRAFEATATTRNRRITTRLWGDITMPPAQVTAALSAKATRQLGVARLN